MIDQGGGAILNTASISGQAADHKLSAYNTVKGGVINLTRSIALDYARQGIRCNAVCPGTVESPSLDDRLRAMGDYDEARAAFMARQPMGRLGKPEEIAALVTYLASDESGFTTGQIHVIDGGWTT